MIDQPPRPAAGGGRYVVHNEGLLLRCGECGEERDLTVLVDPTLSGVPYFQDRNGGWEG